ARTLHLVGDFNNWNPHTDPLARDEFGVWSLFLPDSRCAGHLVHGSRLKVRVTTARGSMDRIPAYSRRVWQDPVSKDFVAELWMPPSPYRFQHSSPSLNGGLRVYEAHVGMAQEEEKVGSYSEFTERVLPRVADLGYDAIQLMAIQEHP